jgi:AcrR family transcriptional regulator
MPRSWPADLALPRGRHQLTREQVAATQCRRICTAMAEVTAAKGYARTSVADIIAAAGVSRETFYQLFSSKQHCFEVAFDASVAALFGDLGATLVPAEGRTPADRFEQGVAAYLDAIADHPAMARLCMVEVFAAGAGAIERRARVQRRLVRGAAALLGCGARDREPSTATEAGGDGACGGEDGTGLFVAQALVAAIDGMVTAALAAGDVEGIRALRVPLTTLVRTTLRAVASGDH